MTAPLPCLENRLKTLATGERAQERLEKLGPAALSDRNCWPCSCAAARAEMTCSRSPTRLIAEAGSLAGPDRLGASRIFKKLNGIGRVKALQLVNVMEMARRVVGQRAGATPLLNRADLVAAHLTPIVAGLEVEKFWVTLPQPEKPPVETH